MPSIISTEYEQPYNTLHKPFDDTRMQHDATYANEMDKEVENPYDTCRESAIGDIDMQNQYEIPGRIGSEYESPYNTLQEIPG